MIGTILSLVGFAIYMVWRIFMFTLACFLMPLLLIDVVRSVQGKQNVIVPVLTRVWSWDPWDEFPWKLDND